MIPAEEPTDIDAEDSEGEFIDIVIDDNTDRSILPDVVLFHLEAGGDAAATAELERRADAELDRMEAEIEAEEAEEE